MKLTNQVIRNENEKNKYPNKRWKKQNRKKWTQNKEENENTKEMCVDKIAACSQYIREKKMFCCFALIRFWCLEPYVCAMWM